MLLPSPTQDLQVPNSSVGTASTRPYLRMRLRRPDSWGYALAPGRKEPSFRVSEHLTGRRGLDP